MPEQKLTKLVEHWDNEEYTKNKLYSMPESPEEHTKIKDQTNRHQNILEEIVFLDKYFFSKYEIDPHKDFISTFYNWLNQFECSNKSLDSEKRYAFILAKNILFINRDQIISLLFAVWDKIKIEMRNIVFEKYNYTLDDIIYNQQNIEDEIFNSVFVPLSDSSHFLEFRHFCLPSGRSKDLTVPCIDRFMLPIEADSEELLNKIKTKYQYKKNLFVIEDFSGSGSTAKKNLRKIIDNFEFDNIYFCPCIITNSAKSELSQLKPYAHKQKIQFNIIEGMTIDQNYSIANKDPSIFWDEDEKKTLRDISRKYFKTHFRFNKYLYDDFQKKNPEKPCPFGFKNGGLTLVLYSNCPNNSLPIIWSNNKWYPLFKRNERYSERIEE